MTKSISKKVWVNTVVKNEENFIYFSLMSVVDLVDKILVWDTGSTDNTVKIIQEVKKMKGNKIDLQEVGAVNKFQFTIMRQKMLEQSDCDWILVLDGDEVWWKESIEKILKLIQKKGDKLDAVVVPFFNLIGDIYHYQLHQAGNYQILNRKGHLQVKFINTRIPGLHLANSYPDEGYFDNQNRPIQKSDKLIFVDAPYVHVSHLSRSSKHRNYRKIKYEIGQSFPPDFKYPESFYLQRADFIPSPWKKMSKSYFIRASIETPLKKIKRLILK